MKVGDLVMVNPSIAEYASVLGDTLGIVTAVLNSSCYPALLEVHWCDGNEDESLYSDELVFLACAE